MIDLKPYYYNPPKTENEKYAYDINGKAYWINEKKIEMLDFKVNEKLSKNITHTLLKNQNERR